jgi:thymidylate synthase (FAD)
VDVKLVSYSKASDEFKEEGLENVQDLIAFCAKVSNPTAQINMETSERLIKYLIKHQHWSPLEMVNAVLEINTTRDIAHQIVRHRSFAFQEFSQRYADPAEMGEMFVLRECRLQDPKNRQNSIALDSEMDGHAVLQGTWKNKQQRVIDASKEAYEWAIENGIAKEQARVVLPEGNTKTRLYMNGTLRSWVHYIELRSANGTQKEHMEIAIACAKAIACIFPLLNDL